MRSRKNHINREDSIDSEMDYDDVTELTTVNASGEVVFTLEAQYFFGNVLSAEEKESNQKLDIKMDDFIKEVKHVISTTSANSEDVEKTQALLEKFESIVKEERQLRKDYYATHESVIALRARFDEAYEALVQSKNDLDNYSPKYKDPSYIKKILHQVEQARRQANRDIHLMEKRIKWQGSATTPAEKTWLMEYQEYANDVKNKFAEASNQFLSETPNYHTIDLKYFNKVKKTIKNYKASNPFHTKVKTFFLPALISLKKDSAELYKEMDDIITHAIADSRNLDSVFIQATIQRLIMEHVRLKIKEHESKVHPSQQYLLKFGIGVSSENKILIRFASKICSLEANVVQKESPLDDKREQPEDPLSCSFKYR